MGLRTYKNYLRTHSAKAPLQEKIDINSEPFQNNAGLLPKPVEYKDIDIAFKEWVEDKLSISFEGQKLETIALFTNQKFSEYMQSWMFNDDDRNMKMNFKIITRENNPQQGTMQGKNMNVVGEPFYEIDKVLTTDKNGRKYFMSYQMRQPMSVDLMYKVSVVTNKYQLLNDFNIMVNNRFKAIQDYINPNGHYMPMKLVKVSDESDYNIDDRQFFSQSFDIQVMAYVLREEDMRVEEQPYYSMVSFDSGGNHNRSKVELEEEPGCERESDLYYQPMKITINIDQCENKVKFNMQGFNFIVKAITGENWRYFRFFKNDTDITNLVFSDDESPRIVVPETKYVPTTQSIYDSAIEKNKNEVLKDFEDDSELGMSERYLTKYLPEAHRYSKKYQKLVLSVLGEVKETHYYRLETEYDVDDLNIPEMSEILISNIRKIYALQPATIVLHGYNPDVVYNRNKDGENVSPANAQSELEIEVGK